MRGIAPHRLAFPVLAAALLAAGVLLFPSPSAGQQTVALSGSGGGATLTITGDDAAEKLTLSRAGDNLVVKGFFKAPTPARCTLVDQKTIHCPFSEFGSILLSMGGASDGVVVAETMPVPLRADLGDGADKFTGSEESDTCIGGPGNDGCTTAGGNDTCFGGPGGDHCLLGGGNDVCRGNADTDQCLGGAGNDLLDGGAAHDGLIGGPGRDRCDPRPGNDTVKTCEVLLARAQALRAVR